MSRTLRGRRISFDNILVGSAAGIERLKGTNSTEVLAYECFTAGTNAARTTDCLDHILTASGGNTSNYTSETIINTN